jgi:hypothetical protein
MIHAYNSVALHSINLANSELSTCVCFLKYTSRTYIYCTGSSIRKESLLVVQNLQNWNVDIF